VGLCTGGGIYWMVWLVKLLMVFGWLGLNLSELVKKGKSPVGCILSGGVGNTLSDEHLLAPFFPNR